ncbi:bifunctional Metallo-beta-lactamase/Zn-dependent metallo-hydrolase [Babesia duncani]|uniref:Bifunctional Metallo-beta-lactamase/Zn-dependent metallo-hydrolase n=1 Tax=Babesia duncani TaxID=323732 RepID=A0AAD9UNX2_9APIC|nr:bifunctional Metallo-beta-lactamase/Zn-dependent metallo-hydrolase [Babesia duncani]
MENVVNNSEATTPANITVLGAGCEVGRSCVHVERSEQSVLFDCGLHPALSGIGALPVFEAIDLSKVNVCLVTHFHLDHCGAIPYLVSKTGFNGRILMTHATRAICHLLWTDYARMEQLQTIKTDYSHGNNSDDEGSVIDELVCGSGLYNHDDVTNALSKIETIDFHEERTIDNIKISCYRAGHVLGACMFLVEMDNVRILYTGDYSTEYDRHVPAAEIPAINAHVLICESTYGIRVHDERIKREQRFLRLVLDVVTRNGKCLLPVFALGRAQEILLILEEYWANNKNLQHIPIFYISPLAAKSLKVYETFVGQCADYIKDAVYQGSNPFYFKYVKYARSVDAIRMHLVREGPCIIMTSPGMLQGGPSLQVFEAIAGDNRNGVILTGYSVKGTLADELKKDPEVLNYNNKVIRRRCLIEQVSFSAHADYQQTREFITKLKVPNVILVHGERGEMTRMRDKLSEEISQLTVFMPEILQVVSLNFSRNSVMNAVGQLAQHIQDTSQTKINQTVATVAVIDDYGCRLMYPQDLGAAGNVHVFSMQQRQYIEFNGTLLQLKDALETIYDDVAIDNNELHVANLVAVKQYNNRLELQWNASPVADLIADSINMVVVQFIADPNRTVKEYSTMASIANDDMLIKVAELQFVPVFGDFTRIKSESRDEIHVFTIPKEEQGIKVNLEINFVTGEVVCEDEDIAQRASNMINSIRASLMPTSLYQVQVPNSI